MIDNVCEKITKRKDYARILALVSVFLHAEEEKKKIQ